MAKNKGKTENLIPLNRRSKEAQREIQSKGGKASAEKKREQILISRIIANYLMNEHEVILRDDQGNVIVREKITATELINRTITGVLAREDSASSSLLKSLAEISEGKNINLSGGVTIVASNTDEKL